MKRYINKEVAKIIGITQRQVLLYSERGIISAYVESSGTWSKREYNYINLLEFGLTKQLLCMGTKFNSVKNIIAVLRDKGILKDWSMNFEAYYNKFFKSQCSVLMKHKMTHLIPKKPHIPEKPVGLIVFYFDTLDDMNMDNLQLIPWDSEMGSLDYDIMKNILVQYKGSLVINIGKIKEEIDGKL
jgi:DNA-binding transcriptional MerR regulator